MTQSKDRTRKLVTLALFSALIAVMTIVPYTGYISYGLVEITTLHIVTMLGTVVVGTIGSGAILGTVWGITCFIRAFTNPLFIMFTNPLISILPRILVGIVAAAIYKALVRTRFGESGACIVAALGGSIINTVGVLTMFNIFGGFDAYKSFYEMFRTVFATVISLNGGIELIAALIIVPVVCRAINSKKKN